jgi:hypothetical protein
MKNENYPDYTPLYFKEADTSSVQELVNSLFFTYNGISYGQATYLDAEFKYEHCRDLKLRSFNDVYDVVNTYFPGTSPAEVFKAVLLSVPKKRDSAGYWGIQLTYCGTMERIRIVHIGNFNNCLINDHKTKNGHPFSWFELLKEAGFTSKIEAIAASDASRIFLEKNV